LSAEEIGVEENGKMLKKLFQISIRLQLREFESNRKIQLRNLVRERERERERENKPSFTVIQWCKRENDLKH
jgi:hypothetical protein